MNCWNPQPGSNDRRGASLSDTRCASGSIAGGNLIGLTILILTKNTSAGFISADRINIVLPSPVCKHLAFHPIYHVPQVFYNEKSSRIHMDLSMCVV